MMKRLIKEVREMREKRAGEKERRLEKKLEDKENQ